MGCNCMASGKIDSDALTVLGERVQELEEVLGSSGWRSELDCARRGVLQVQEGWSAEMKKNRVKKDSNSWLCPEENEEKADLDSWLSLGNRIAAIGRKVREIELKKPRVKDLEAQLSLEKKICSFKEGGAELKDLRRLSALMRRISILRPDGARLEDLQRQFLLLQQIIDKAEGGLPEDLRERGMLMDQIFIEQGKMQRQKALARQRRQKAKALLLMDDTRKSASNTL